MYLFERYPTGLTPEQRAIMHAGITKMGAAFRHRSVSPADLALLAAETDAVKDCATVNDFAVRAAQAAACVGAAPTHELATHHASEAARYAVETARAFYALHLGQPGGDLIANGEHEKQIEDLCALLRKETGRCVYRAWEFS